MVSTGIAVVGYLLLAFGPLVVGVTGWARRRLRHRRGTPLLAGDPSVQLLPRAPVERLTADLHRLVGQLDALERGNAPAKCARMQATVLAYDAVLLDACRALQVHADGPPPLGPFARLQAEAELSKQGLRW